MISPVALAVLVERVQQKDQDALSDIIALTEAWLLLRLRQLGLQAADAEDVAVLTFFELWRRARSIHDPLSTLAWLGRVADRIGLRRWSETRRHRALPLDAIRVPPLCPSEPAPAISPDELMAGLSDVDRTILTLRFLGGLSVQEVAARIGVTENQIDSAMKRCRARLSYRFPELARQVT